MSQKNAGKGCLVLFGLPFFLIGLAVMFFFAVKPLMKIKTADSWTPTSAMVLESQLKTNHSSDSTTYQAVGRYTYQVNGQEYQSTELSFFSGSDNIGSYHQDLSRTLSRAMAQKEKITVYVNPENPSEAVYDRSIRWSMFLFSGIFGLIFSGIGAAVMMGGFFGDRLKKRKKGKKNKSGQTVFTSSSGGKFLFIFFFAFVWNCFPVVMLVSAWDKVSSMSMITLFYVVFQLVGLALIGAAIYQMIKSFKYGKSSFHLEKGCIGGEFNGFIVAPENIYPENGYYSISFESIHTYSTGSGDNRSTHRDIKWSRSVRLEENKIKHEFDGYHIPISFTIPYSCKETSDDPNYSWVLKASAATPGIDWEEEFKIPLYKTEESNPELTEDVVKSEEVFHGLDTVKEALAEEKVVLERREDGSLSIHTPRMRSIIGALVSFLITVGVTLGAGFALYKGEYFLGIIVSVFALISTLFFVLSAIVEHKAIVDHKGARSVDNVLFFSIRRKVLIDEKTKFRIKNNMTSGETRYWSMYVGEVKLFSNVKNKQALEQLELYMKETMFAVNASESVGDNT